MMLGSRHGGPFVAAAWVAATALVGSAHAQTGRLSLAERVARLEAQSQGQSGQSLVELLNRIEDLQSEVQALRGLVEKQAFEIEEMKKRARDQYIDLDSRISRLEGDPGAIGASSAIDSQAGSAPVPTQDGLGTSTRPGQLVIEPPTQSVSEPADPAAVAAPAESQPATTTTIPEVGEQAAYDLAFDALREGRYAESARRFSEFLERYPHGELADNAMYWLGESYYVTQNYQIALDTFRSLIANYPQSPKAQDALLKVGYCLYELKQWSAAEAALNDVIARYPGSTVARLAQGRLRALRLEGKTP